MAVGTRPGLALRGSPAPCPAPSPPEPLPCLLPVPSEATCPPSQEGHQGIRHLHRALEPGRGAIAQGRVLDAAEPSASADSFVPFPPTTCLSSKPKRIQRKASPS